MAIAGGVATCPGCSPATLVGMVLLNMPFAWLVKKLPRSRFIPLTYRFFAVNIVLFAVALHLASASRRSVGSAGSSSSGSSVYNLFVVSVFWQLNVDLFSPEQGKRLFGFIAAGATIGAIVGSAGDREAGALRLADRPAGVAPQCCSRSRCSASAAWRSCRPCCTTGRATRPRPGGRDAGRRQRAGGHLHAFRSPYLLSVSAFLLLYAVTSTFVYFQQAAIVSHSFTDRGAQTAFFASIDFGVNSLALVLPAVPDRPHRRDCWALRWRSRCCRRSP